MCYYFHEFIDRELGGDRVGLGNCLDDVVVAVSDGDVLGHVDGVNHVGSSWGNGNVQDLFAVDRSERKRSRKIKSVR